MKYPIFVEIEVIMKFIKFLAITFLLIVLLVACKNTGKNEAAITYFNEIEALQNSFKLHLDQSLNALEADISRQKADSLRVGMIAYIDSSKIKLDGLNFDKSDDNLKSTFNNLLNHYHKTYAEAYPKIFSIRFDAGKQTEENVVVLSEIIRTLDVEETDLVKSFVDAQNNFKTTYKITE